MGSTWTDHPPCQAKQTAQPAGHVPLFILVGQEEILHLLAPEIQFVVIVALHSFCLIDRIIQGEEELFEAFHHRWGNAEVYLGDVAQPGKKEGRVLTV